MWKQVRAAFNRLRGRAEGATAIEYALIVLFIGLVLLTMQNSIGTSVSSFFMSVATGL